MARLNFNYQNALTTLNAGSVITIPISLQTPQPVTAISLVMKYLSEYIKIKEVVMTPITNFSWFLPTNVDSELRIGWFNVDYIDNFSFNVKCEVIKDVPLGVQVMFSLYEADPINPLNEIAGADYNPVEDVILNTTSYAQKATVAARKTSQGYTSKPFVKSCSNCAEKTTNKCTIGSFVVAAKGLCDLYQPI